MARRRCAVCQSEHVNEANRLLVRGVPAGDVAQLFKLKLTTVQRHTKLHVPKMLALAHAERLALDADGLMREVEHLYQSAKGLLDEAQVELCARPVGTSARDRAFIMATQAVREVGRLLEFIAQLFEKLPKPKEEVTIRITDARQCQRDEFSDITRSLPGLQALPSAPGQSEAGRPGGGEKGGADGN
jgi:hypothetical protein